MKEKRGVELWERKADVSGGGRGGGDGFQGNEQGRMGKRAG